MTLTSLSSVRKTVANVWQGVIDFTLDDDEDGGDNSTLIDTPPPDVDLQIFLLGQWPWDTTKDSLLHTCF
jgi:hypothetical protein